MFEIFHLAGKPKYSAICSLVITYYSFGVAEFHALWSTKGLHFFSDEGPSVGLASSHSASLSDISQSFPILIQKPKNHPQLIRGEPPSLS